MINECEKGLTRFPSIDKVNMESMASNGIRYSFDDIYYYPKVTITRVSN